MTKNVFILGLAVFGAVSGGAWMVQSAQAENAPAPNPPAAVAPATGSFALGYVDLRRIGKEFEGTKSSQAELDAFQGNLQKQYEERESVRFLDEKEREEVNKLRAVAAPSEEQKKQLGDFLATSKSREAQLRALQQNPNKSEQEKADADRLTKLTAKTDEDIDALTEQLEAQFKAKGDEISKKLTDTVSAAIEVVAKEKGYTAVVDKTAMLYGGIDVTEDVLKQLNKK